MARISVETKAEVTMIKFLSSVNQLLLFHCFLVMLLAEMVRTEYEDDNAIQEDEDDESFLTERAYAVTSLLPCLAALTLGAVVVSGGRRVFVWYLAWEFDVINIWFFVFIVVACLFLIVSEAAEVGLSYGSYGDPFQAA